MKALFAICLVALAAVVSFGAPRLALAQSDAYKQHLDNGVKLYQDQNYQGAIVEFEAAYQERPKASPLVNLALCYKKLFKYPKAIATLETALAKHGDTMEASDKQAARDAIAEMKQLLGYASVRVSPPGATVTVDGEAASGEVLSKPIPLAPGQHTFGASMPGYVAAQQQVTIASGEQPQAVTLTLARISGTAPPPEVGPPIGPRTDKPTPKRKLGLLITGAVLAAFGVVNAAIGVVFVASDQCVSGACTTSFSNTKPNLGPQKAAGAVALVTGGVLIAAGVPMMVIGAHKSAPRPVKPAAIRPFFLVGPSRAEMVLTF
jgi:Tetratricopeptide repeat/PEGA domain